MSKDNSIDNASSSEEDEVLFSSPLLNRSTFSLSSTHPGGKHKKKTEAQKLRQEAIAAYNLDGNLIHSGTRLLRSQKTLCMSDEDTIRLEIERERLKDEEISLRPLRPGQRQRDERFQPGREDFEYIYSHIDQLDCQTWASHLEPWLNFVNNHNLYADPSLPILDKDGIGYPDCTFSLDSLLKLSGNKKYLKKNSRTHEPKTSQQTSSTSGDQNLSDNTPANPGSSSSSSSSFVIIHNQDVSNLNETLNPNLLNFPPSTGVTPTGTPEATPPPSPPPIDSDSDSDMTSLKERSVFFPSEKFDGRNKALTKQHWQTFEDFCDQQKLYVEDRDGTTATAIDQIQPFFKMTLTDLARAWLDRQNFDTAKQLKEKFLTDFSPYGKSHRQWIAKWTELKFNPDIDNIDEFFEKFEDLAKLNNLQDDYKLHAFKIAMPKEIELHLRSITNLSDCYQTAKELLTIVQNQVSNKMSTLSLAQSRSPSPQPRSRSPSPVNPSASQPTTDRSRSRTRQNFEGFRQYPGPSRPQSIMKRPFMNTRGRGRGRPMFNRQSRSRSLTRNRLPIRCFNCNMVGHIARNCFTRTRSQSLNRAKFPRRFTPNFRRNQRQMNQRQGNQRPQQPRVRFQNQNNNRYQQNGYQGSYQNPNRNQNRSRYQNQNTDYYPDVDVTDQYYNGDQDDYQNYDLN